MKQKIIDLYKFIKEALFDDIADRYLFLATILLFAIVYLIWHFSLSGPDVFVYLKISLYPIKFLATIITVNTLLAIASHNKEREISNLILMTNVIITFLIFALEIYYITNK